MSYITKKSVFTRLSLALIIGGALLPSVASADGQPPNPIETASSAEYSTPVVTHIVDQKDEVQVVLSELTYDMTTGRAGLTFNLTTDREIPVEEVTINAHFFNDDGKEVASKEMPILRGDKNDEATLLASNNPQEKQIWIQGLSDPDLTEDQVKFEITQVSQSF